MRYIIILSIISLLLSSFTYAVCVEPESGMVIDASVEFCSGEYDIDEEMTIAASDITVICDNTTLQTALPITAIRMRDVEDVALMGCAFRGFANAVYIEGSFMNSIMDNYFFDNNNAIIQQNSLGNMFEGNAFNGNQRDMYSFNIEMQPEEIVPEVPVVYDPVLMFELDENTTVLYNEIQRLFSGYIDNSSSMIGVRRDIVYDPGNDVTTIVLTFTPSYNVSNYSYYEKIPKCLAEYISDIVFSDSGYEVIADDPLVMWNFAEVRNAEKVSYSVERQIGEDCLELLDGFGFATDKIEPIIQEDARYNLKMYVYALIGIILTIMIVRFILWIKNISN